MNKENKVETVVVDGMEIKDPLKIKLSKPITFEGKEYAELDLSALNGWTCENLIAATKVYEKAHATEAPSAAKAFAPESDLEYCFFVAAYAIEKPVELFKKLSVRDGKKVQTAIILFFNTEV